jgi:hypothetical protein|tara:strand:+ start:510 stop:1787 length:1278 start_codon:yes stop_codon:yes gene_type:complete
MSFIVVNTGRVASQYFYINLKLQPGVIMPSRYAFDHVVKSYVKRRYSRPISELRQWYVEKLSHNSGAELGIVFHSVRPNLAYPFVSDRNISFLSAIRDSLGIDTIYFPVRDPKEVFLSELNRQLARRVGDWSYPEGLNGWRKNLSINDFAILNESILVNDADPSEYFSKPVTEVDLWKISEKISIRTGKIFSLYELFSKVFNKVLVFNYRELIENPEAIFERMGKQGGFQFIDRTLVHTRLNSLANRFLLYNSFDVSLGWRTETFLKKSGLNFDYKSGLLRFFRLLRSSMPRVHLRFGRHCRFRFEIPEVIPICEDWGKHQQVSVVPASTMKSVIKALGSDLALAVRVDDANNLYDKELDALATAVSRVIAPRFDLNFQIMYKFYRENVYLRDVQINELYNIFWTECEKEYEKLWKMDKSVGSLL